MPDPKQTVERIRATLHSEDVGSSIDVTATAADYAELCREANFRLRRCADFLRDGLVGEAVGHASNPPPLLDLVGALEFSEFQEWERKCTTLGLSRPGRLAVETIPDIRQAFEKHEPLRDLLAKHRYLALARANLADRLTILRQFIAVDPGNASWKHDAEEMERARLADIRNETAAAVRAGDADGVGKLLAELSNNPWQTPGADELKNTLSQTSAALYQATAFDQLRALVPAVREAVANGQFLSSLLPSW